MTEKRYFKEDFYNEYAIKKQDTIIAIVDSGSNARRICNELNALHEEKEYWKSKYKQEVEKHSIITAVVDKNGNWHRIPKELQE